MKSDEKIKVVHLLYTLKDQGGLQRVVASLSNYWSVLGYTVEVWVWEETTESFFVLDWSIKVRSIGRNPDIVLYNSKLQKIAMFFLLWIRGRRNYIVLLKDTNPTIVIIHRSEINDPFMGFQQLHNRTIELLHTPFYLKRPIPLSFFTKIQRALFYKFLQIKMNLVTVTKSIMNDALGAGWNKVRHIPNAVPFTSGRKSTTKNKIIISAGRNTPEKGFDRLIEAFAVVAKKHSDWKLLIIGKGVSDINNNLNSLVDKYDLKERVQLMNQVENLLDYYINSSIYVLSSFYEAMPMVLLEAMECGLPIVYPEIRGLEEVVNDNCSLIYENGNAMDMANKMIFLIENEEKRKEMGRYAIEHVKKFHIDNIATQWQELFDEIVLKKQ